VAIKLMSEGDLAAHVDEVAAYVDVRKGAMFGTLSFADDRDKQRFRLSRMRARDLQRGPHLGGGAVAPERDLG